MCSKPSYFLLLFLERIVEIKQGGVLFNTPFYFWSIYGTPDIYIHMVGDFFLVGSVFLCSWFVLPLEPKRTNREQS